MSTSRQPHRTISGTAFLGCLAVLIALLGLYQFRQSREAGEAARPFISEIQAANRNGLPDDDGQIADWIELWNPSTETLDLEGWFLTDDFRQLPKWRFPAVRLAPGEFLVIFATGKDRTNGAAPLHTNFRLDPAGEYLALIGPQGGQVVQEFLPKYPRQIVGASFGLTPEVFGRAGKSKAVSAGELGFLLTPTPGAANTDELLGLVEDTRFSRQRGVYTNAFQLEISTKTYETQIRYTLDGTAPNLTNGFAYTAPLAIGDTITVRAAAFRPGYQPSNVDTHTFVFPQGILRQTGGGFPTTWGVRDGNVVTADYEIDPEIVEAPNGRQRLTAGLNALPSVSLVLAPADLFGEAAGLYAHPVEHGAAWERPGSFEWFMPDGSSEAHTDCGVRIQGGWSRRPEESPKHSFQLLFRAEYGAATFKHGLFGASGPKSARELILRAGSNNSWLHWSGAERKRGDLLRDQWMRDTLREMKRPSPRGTFVHLYLNGLYWGIYNLVERPDADFLAQQFGGSAGDYDARNGENVLSGDTVVWDRLFAVSNAGVTNATAYAELSRLLDVPAFIDFMAVHLYGGSADMDRASNWYAARPRRTDGKYVFLMWDGERSLEEVGASSLKLDDDQCPTRLFQRLRQNPEFQRAFSRRVKELTQAGGGLSPEPCANRYRGLVTEVRAAMVCESARWGDYRRDVHPYREGPFELYTVEQHWEPEVKRLLEDYFPRRTAAFIQQLREANLYLE